MQHRVSPSQLAVNRNQLPQDLCSISCKHPQNHVSAHTPLQQKIGGIKKQKAILSEGVLHVFPQKLQDMVMQLVDVGHVT